ncbi:hypothetical protein JIN84_14145 [Luteolibacter yonseiensis]|uniref:Uncharacterized protein n=1 Tax=Luteolibacter yonseiensis TaxID=1144680 RepID=A0A934R6A4_9BACT|nr:hypothetical protein [Luteolibacter yonseiensis]MBK1816763.1 hypothetical protein [Luteolibacter yonseiensis]
MTNKALIGIPFGCVAAAVTGYLLASRPSAVAGNGTGIPSPETRSEALHDRASSGKTSNSSVKNRSAAQRAALKENLRMLFEHSTDAAHDWPMREQAAAILATMSPQELEQFSKEWRFAGSVTNMRSFREIEDPLYHEILEHWGRKDPQAACLSLAETNIGALGEVFAQWQQRDPAAARAWLEQAHFPKESDEMRAIIQRNFLKQQVTDDFAAAREALATLKPDDQKQMLEEWSRLLAHDPDKRAELLSHLASRGDAELTAKCYKKLIEEMADKSPNEAAVFIEFTNLPEEQKNKLNDQVIGNWALKDPEQAFAKWAALGREDVPAKILEAISQWGSQPPDRPRTVEWIKTLPTGPARDKFSARVIGRNSDQEDAELSASLSDPKQRIEMLKTMKRRWEASAPNDAKAWFEKLPQADKDALGKAAE